MKKLVSLCPSNTELLDFMGLTPNLIGVDDYSTWPPEINSLRRLGSDQDIDMDVVEELNPDLVVASLTVPGMERNIERLKERNLPYIILNPDSFVDIGENILKVGDAIGDKKLAQTAYHHYHSLYETCKKSSQQIKEKPSIYWEWWPKPIFTAGANNWLTELSDLAGACNVFAHDERGSVKTDWDDVKGRNPDYIFLTWVGVDVEKVNPTLLQKRPNWQAMDALKNDRVLVLGDTPFCRPSPRLFIGIQKVRSILHPNLFAPFDQQEAEEWLYGNT